MLKVTIFKQGEDQTYWFLTASDAVNFLNSVEGNEQTRADEQRHAPAEAGGGGLAHCVGFIITPACFGVVVGAKPPASAGDRAPRWA